MAKTAQEILVEFGLDEDKIRQVNQIIDGLIDKKTKELQGQLSTKDSEITKLTNELEPLKKEKEFKTTLEGFKKSGGKEDIDLSDYNYQKYAKEDGSIDWDKFFEKHPALKAEAKKLNKDSALEDDDDDNIDIKAEVLKEQEAENQMKTDSKLANV